MFLRLRKSNRKKNGHFIFEDVCFQMRRAGFVNEMFCFFTERQTSAFTFEKFIALAFQVKCPKMWLRTTLM